MVARSILMDEAGAARLKPMERRVLDIAEGQRHLSKKRGSLEVVKDPDTSQSTRLLIPFDEIESVVVHSPQATYSNSALVELARRGIPLVFCDKSHMPAAWLWPVRANFEQSRRMAAQAALPEDLRNALWAKLVRAKIESQASVIRDEGFANDTLLNFADSVQPGDSKNAEAQAARLYWKLLFDDVFRRHRHGVPPNGLLNYGYAVLCATVARHVCAAGLHPSLGLHHHNRFDAYCLADDLMEPFRPSVDRIVLSLWRAGHQLVTPETKPVLASVLAENMSFGGQAVPLSRCVERSAQSLAQSVIECEDRLRLPSVV